jgi:hypothetical protein
LCEETTRSSPIQLLANLIDFEPLSCSAVEFVAGVSYQWGLKTLNELLVDGWTGSEDESVC